MMELHVLSLGAGVQSTTVYLLSLDGKIQRFDAAIFADTQDEPEAVYRHLSWLTKEGAGRIPIIITSAGRLGDDLTRGMNTTGQLFVSIPAYTAPPGVTPASGQTRRQCTKEYKTQPVERAIRRQLCGLAPGRRIPKSIAVHRYFGISTDEARRAVSIRERLAGQGECHFPLIEMGWSRGHCARFNEQRCPHEVTRSACVFCPYKSDAEWLRLKREDPIGWSRAVEIDTALRDPEIRKKKHRESLYVHRSAQPLATVILRNEGQGVFPYFALECEGMCGV